MLRYGAGRKPDRGQMWSVLFNVGEKLAYDAWGGCQ